MLKIFQPDNIWMIVFLELLQESYLSDRTRWHSFLRVCLYRDFLQRHVRTLVPSIPRLVDRPVRTPADLGRDLVVLVPTTRGRHGANSVGCHSCDGLAGSQSAEGIHR